MPIRVLEMHYCALRTPSDPAATHRTREVYDRVLGLPRAR